MAIMLSIPGDTAHLPVLRATAASVAARARLTIDQMEDVRLAVEEAATALLGGHPQEIELTIDPDSLPLTLTLAASMDVPVMLEPSGFSWTILAAMTDEFTVESNDDRVSLTMKFASLATAS